jgi:hypothetical protein
MQQFGFPEDLIKVIEDAYAEGTTIVQIGQRKTNPITIKRGVKQGCPLSPLLFNLCLEPLIERLESIADSSRYSIGNANEN